MLYYIIFSIFGIVLFFLLLPLVVIGFFQGRYHITEVNIPPFLESVYSKYFAFCDSVLVKLNSDHLRIYD